MLLVVLIWKKKKISYEFTVEPLEKVGSSRLAFTSLLFFFISHFSKLTVQAIQVVQFFVFCFSKIFLQVKNNLFLLTCYINIIMVEYSDHDLCVLEPFNSKLAKTTKFICPHQRYLFWRNTS